MNEEANQVQPNQKLFVGGLAWAATDQDLVEAFSQFGELAKDESGKERASVVRYPDTGRSKGFGFVEYVTVDDAVKAKEGMDGKDIAGRPVKVDFARPREQREQR